MLKEYKSLRNNAQKEIIIEKSIFIGTAQMVEDESQALEFIQAMKKKYHDSTHNVHAYVLGDDNNIQRFSDDGEPSGTAGIPVLKDLKKNDLRNVCIVVTRYFGGIKLGKGGLVRAYGKAAVAALEASEIIWRRLYKVVEINADYTLLGMLQNQLKLDDYQIRDIRYDEMVHLEVYVLHSKTEDFQTKIIDWCNGKVDLKIIDEEYLIEEC